MIKVEVSFRHMKLGEHKYPSQAGINLDCFDQHLFQSFLLCLPVIGRKVNKPIESDRALLLEIPMCFGGGSSETLTPDFSLEPRGSGSARVRLCVLV